MQEAGQISVTASAEQEPENSAAPCKRDTWRGGVSETTLISPSLRCRRRSAVHMLFFISFPVTLLQDYFDLQSNCRSYFPEVSGSELKTSPGVCVQVFIFINFFVAQQPCKIYLPQKEVTRTWFTCISVVCLNATRWQISGGPPESLEVWISTLKKHCGLILVILLLL